MLFPDSFTKPCAIRYLQNHINPVKLKESIVTHPYKMSLLLETSDVLTTSILNQKVGFTRGTHE